MSARARYYEALAGDVLEDHQHPPDTDWRRWIFEAGRGAGKTRAVSHQLVKHLLGPVCDHRVPGGHRVAILAPTLEDAVGGCWEGPSGLNRLLPGAGVKTLAGKGTRIIAPGLPDIPLRYGDSPRGAARFRANTNLCFLWIEEAAHIRYLTAVMKVLKFSMRLGDHPRIAATTTPLPTPAYLDFREQQPRATAFTHASTLDNPHLAAAVKDELVDEFGGTTWGLQELEGKVISEVEGSLWRRPWIIYEDKLPDGVHPVRIIGAIDPADSGDGDEVGIIIGMLGSDGRTYIISDLSKQVSAAEWPLEARDAWRSTHMGFNLQMMLVEGTGASLKSHETMVRQVEPACNVVGVLASSSKQTRAVPVAALYKHHKVVHLGSFGKLESEMLTWTGDKCNWSPNRLDALVHLVRELHNLTDAKRSSGPKTGLSYYQN